VIDVIGLTIDLATKAMAATLTRNRAKASRAEWQAIEL